MEIILKKKLTWIWSKVKITSQTTYPRGTHPPDLEVWDKEQKNPPIVQVETVRDLLLHLDCHKSVGPDGIHLRVLRELVDMIAKPLSISYQWSWSNIEVPDDWILAYVTPIYKKGHKECGGFTLLGSRTLQQLLSQKRRGRRKEKTFHGLR